MKIKVVIAVLALLALSGHYRCLAQAPSAADVRNTLELEASVADSRRLNPDPYCGPSALGAEQSRVLKQIQVHDYASGEAGAGLAAGMMAFCALHNHIPLPIAAMQTGLMLAMQALAGKALFAGSLTPALQDSAIRGRLLLEYAKANGQSQAQEVLDSLDKQGIGRGEGTEQTSGQFAGAAAATLTAHDAVELYEGNEISFNQRYAGKQITITGSLRIAIASSDGKSAYLTIPGIDRGDNTRLSDEISCIVTGGKGLAEVAELAPKEKISVTGIYDTQLSSTSARIVLSPCKINQVK